MNGKTPLRRSAWEEALRRLDRRALSEKELRGKLSRAGYDAGEIGDAVAECRRRRFIDDASFAENFCDELLRAGNGPGMIRMKLARRGIGAAEIADALGKDPQRERESCEQACRAKWRALSRESDPRKKREKLYRYLAGKGFSASSARDAIEKIRAGETINDADFSLNV